MNAKGWGQCRCLPYRSSLKMNAVSRRWGYFKIHTDFFSYSLFLQSAKISTSLFAHGISVFVGFRTDSFFPGAISCVALFCYVYYL